MKCKILTLSAAIALTLGGPAIAGMSKPEYLSSKERIAADYKVSKTACDSLKANAKDVCVAQARGAEKMALADLAAEYEPSTKSRYNARMAHADAVYAVSKEKCDDQAGNAKDVCVKEAKLVKTTAEADARAQMKIVDARKDAGKEIAEVRKDAAADKREATYALAKERCKVLAGSQKDACMAEAKALFDKS